MSQLRKDVFTGQWVIVAETEAVQPRAFRFKKFTRETTFCPFYETAKPPCRPKCLPSGLGAHQQIRPAWRVWVVPNSHFRLRIEGDLARRPEGLHDMILFLVLD